MSSKEEDRNLDQEVINSFGHEWGAFKYVDTHTDDALDTQFEAYCRPIDLHEFNPKISIAGDFGAGSGRWSHGLLPFFSSIYVLEPSDGAIIVLKDKFFDRPQIVILQETVEANSIPENSVDLALSLGVLHHIPDTGLAIRDVASKIKSGRVFLCYLYYKLINKPLFYCGLQTRYVG